MTLLHAPLHVTDEERALLTVGQLWSRWTRTRTLVLVLALMHLVGAVTIAFAPRSQLYTQGARPALLLMPRGLWALVFLAGGLGAASLLHRYTGLRQWATWLFVVPTQIVWVSATALAVFSGHGGALSVVFLPAMLMWTLTTASFVLWDYAHGSR